MKTMHSKMKRRLSSNFPGLSNLNEKSGQYRAESGQSEIPNFLIAKLHEDKSARPSLVAIIETAFPEAALEDGPTLVAVDDTGNEIIEGQNRPAWQLPKGEFTQEAFIACHIKYWGRKPQKSRWNKIITALYTQYGQELKIRREWIVNLIQWARDKNAGRYAIAVSIDNLMSAIENDTNYEDFKRQYFRKGVARI